MQGEKAAQCDDCLKLPIRGNQVEPLVALDWFGNFKPWLLRKIVDNLHASAPKRLGGAQHAPHQWRPAPYTCSEALAGLTMCRNGWFPRWLYIAVLRGEFTPVPAAGSALFLRRVRKVTELAVRRALSRSEKPETGEGSGLASGDWPPKLTRPLTNVKDELAWFNKQQPQ